VGSEGSAIQFSATHTSTFCIVLGAFAIASEGQKVQIQSPYPPVDVSRPSVMSAHRPCPLNTDFGTASGRQSTAPQWLAPPSPPYRASTGSLER
jgi:hypothetical protein